MNNLQLRNAQSAADTLERVEAALCAQGQRVNRLNEGLASLSARIADLERMVATGKAIAYGHGPTT